MLMPTAYESPEKDYWHLINNVTIWDVAAERQLEITGSDAYRFVEYITPRDLSSLQIGQGKYAFIADENGGIINDPIILRLEEQRFWLSIADSDVLLWTRGLACGLGWDVQIHEPDVSPLAIQGPKAIEAMQSLTSEDLSAIKFYTFKVAAFAGIEHVIISATGYTGSGGFEVYCKNSEVEQLWKKVMEAGAEFGIKPIGLAARDTLRLEMGYCLYGNEINDITSPISAGLGWISKTSTGSINATAIEEQKRTGTSQRLVGFKMDIKGRIPRAAYQIVDSNGDIIGNVTSGTQSPILSEGIGLGYVDMVFTKPGKQIGILIRGKIYSAHIVKLPFIKS